MVSQGENQPEANGKARARPEAELHQSCLLKRISCAMQPDFYLSLGNSNKGPGVSILLAGACERQCVCS